MGMLVDLTRCDFHYDVTTDKTTGGAVVPGFNFEVAPIAFKIKYGITFIADPRRGFGGSPADMENWTVGIVQNVLFEKLRLEYDNGDIFETDFDTAVLDSRASKFNLPFVYDRPTNPRPGGGWRPFAEIVYTSKGYGYFIDPWDPSKFDNKPDFVDMIDSPSLAVKLIRAGDAFLKKLSRISSFQTWLIAEAPTQTFILANVPPVSVIYEYETDPPTGFGFARQINTTPTILNWRADAFAGIVKTFAAKGSGAAVRVEANPGRRRPVMIGDTANARGQKWLSDNGLI